MTERDETVIIRETLESAWIEHKAACSSPDAKSCPSALNPSGGRSALAALDSLTSELQKAKERKDILVADWKLALKQRDEARQRAERYEKALRGIDTAKLDLLADWFDQDDANKGNTSEPEVQADLRRWARAVRKALVGEQDVEGVRE